MAHIGVLALQGGYAAHARMLRALGHNVHEVRTAADLHQLQGLVLPGGESSTQLMLIERNHLAEPLHAFVAAGHPVFATCAGLILAAGAVTNPVQSSLGWLSDVHVTRNAWGRQVHSFEACADDTDLPLVFIRAPRITHVGPKAEVLLRYHGEPVMVRQGNVVGATFHPELTEDTRIHARVFGTHTSDAA